MTRARIKTVSIDSDPQEAPLTPAQKTFNSRIKQIEKRRNTLSEWETAVPPFRDKYAKEYLPLIEASTKLEHEFVRALDWACAQKGITKSEHRLMSELIVRIAGYLIDSGDDPELKEIYLRHGGEDDNDIDQDDVVDAMKDALEDLLGHELDGLDDIHTPEEILERAQAHFAAEDEAREARRAKRKKTPKQIAAEAQREADAAELSQSIREIYRKLAGALHPDRETDPAERERKTLLMQRVNDAYEKNKLLQLLELQLELEHIDQNAINTLSAERLGSYNRILQEQVRELDEELLHVEHSFRAEFCISPHGNVAPKTLVTNLNRDITRLTQTIRVLENDLAAFQDIKTLKAWLKGI